MRKLYEIVMVIAAAGLAASLALIDIPTHSADPGMVTGGEALFAVPPPTIAPSFPPLPPLLAPPGSSTPAPSDPAATPASPLSLRPQGVTEAASAAVGVLGASSVPRAPSTTADPPAAKTKPPAKIKPPPKPKSETKPDDRDKTASTGSSPKSGPAADSASAARGR
jgi:hypothetical protein